MMKSKKNINKGINDQNRFLTACVCSILLLLTLCYFGVNNVFKGTSANTSVSYCGSGENLIASGSSYYCCPSVYGTGATIVTYGGNSYCVPDNVEVGELLASETSNPTCAVTVDYTLSASEQKIYDTYTYPATGVKFLAGNSSTVNNIINKVETNLNGNGWDIQRVDIDFNNDNQKDYNCTFNPDTVDGQEYLVRCEMESTLSDGCFAKTSMVSANGDACYYTETNGEKTYIWGDYKNTPGFTLDPSYTKDIDCLGNGKYDIVINPNGADGSYTSDFGAKNIAFNDTFELSSLVGSTPTKTLKVIVNKNGISNLSVGSTENTTIEFNGIRYDGYSNKNYDSQFSFSYSQYGNGKQWRNLVLNSIIDRTESVRRLAPDGFVAKFTYMWKSTQIELPEISKNGSLCSWNTKADRSGTEYSSAQVINTTNDMPAEFNLYAFCDAVPTATIYANGGSLIGSNGSLTKSTLVKTCTMSSTGVCNLEFPTPISTNGKSFVGWSTSSTCSSKQYIDIVELKNNVNYYACWSDEPFTLDNSTKYADVKITLPDSKIEGVGLTFIESLDDYFNPWTGKCESSNTSVVTCNTTAGGELDYDLNLTAKSVGTAIVKVFIEGTEVGSDGKIIGEEFGSVIIRVTVTDGSGTISPTSYTVLFDANGGTVNPTTKTVTFGSTYGTLPTPTRTGHTFNGWYTAKTGGTKVTGSTTVSTASNHSLYAQWSPNRYNVKYDANGGSGAPSAQIKIYDTALTLSKTIPTKTGWNFASWNTKADGSGTNYNPGGSITNAAFSGLNNGGTLTLYAVWDEDVSVATYTITYDANGGSGAPSAQTKKHGETLILSSNKPTRTDYTFLGWSTSATATIPTYSAGGYYTNNANAKLFAVWFKNNNDEPTEHNAVIPTSSLCKSGLVYNGKVQQLVNSTSGTGYYLTGYSQTNADTYTITAQLSNGFKWSDNSTGVKTFNCSIAKATPTLTLDMYSTAIEGINSMDAIPYTYNGDGVVSCNSKDNSLVDCNIVSGNLFVVSKKLGTVVVEVKATETQNYKAVSKEVSVTIKEKTSGGDVVSKTFMATFLPNGGTLNGGGSKSCTTTGSSCEITSLPTATRTGYTFKGWGENSSCSSGATNKLTLDKNSIYYACFVKDKTPTVDKDGNTTGNPTTGNITIALVWFAGIFAIAYAFWYFKKSKEN